MGVVSFTSGSAGGLSSSGICGGGSASARGLSEQAVRGRTCWAIWLVRFVEN